MSVKAPETIETDRCVLSSFLRSDEGEATRLYTDAVVRRFLGGPVSLSRAERTFDAWLSGNGSLRRWAVRRKTDGALIGMVSLAPHHEPADIEISYMFLPEFWRRGLGTEVVSTVIDYAFQHLRLPRIVAETQSANIASRRLLERIGMRVERHLVRFNAEQSLYSMNNPHHYERRDRGLSE